jgi:hypothetical protein
MGFEFVERKLFEDLELVLLPNSKPAPTIISSSIVSYTELCDICVLIVAPLALEYCLR